MPAHRDEPQPMPPAPRPYVFNDAGWTLLGERGVDGRMDADRIDISQKQGKFNKITVVVLDSDLEMVDFRVQFVSGKSFNPEVKQVFNEGTRTRIIDLPNTDPMRLIEFKYKNLPGGGKARVQVWAR